MTPARNNVRATRHFGIPARKSSPSAPLQPFPREKTRPARPSNRSRAKKFAQQQPHLGQTAKKLSQRAQKHQNLAIFPEQGELFRVSNAAPPSRENFLPQLHHSIPITGTPPPNHHPNRYKTLPATPPTTRSAGGTSQHAVQNSPCNTRHKAQPVENSPCNTRHKAQPVQNPPSTPTINENWPFLASKENYFPFPTPHHRAGRIFSRNNTILVSISTQLTGWSLLSPRHQTNAPLSSALCGLLAAHHDAAPERAGTGRRLADWKRPRNPQASSLHPTTRTNVSDVWPRHPEASFEPKLSTGTCAELEGHDQSAHS